MSYEFPGIFSASNKKIERAKLDPLLYDVIPTGLSAVIIKPKPSTL